jgi:glycosyltransferase involved in cell wall biosynthesis
LVDSKQTAETTIYSTFPPFGAHLAALLLARNEKLKWIADFRDPMYLGRPELTRFQRAAFSACERSMLKRANAVIVTTDTLADEWKCRYPDLAKRIHVIWNGFDPDDRIEEDKPPQRSYRLFSHVGALYGGRNITPLLESVSRLIEARRLWPDRLRIRLVGGMNNDCLPSAEFLARATKEGWLELIAEHLPRSDARRMAQDSDGLLLVQPHTTVQVPAKLVEYLRLRRPILAFIPSGSPIEKILKSSGVTYQAVYTGTRPQDFDDALEIFVKHSGAGEAPTAWFQQNFDAGRQTAELARLIQSLHQPAVSNRVG